MAGKIAFVLLGFVAVQCIAICTAPTRLTVVTETTVPPQPYAGNAMFWVLNGKNGLSTNITFSTCTATLSNGSYSFSTPNPIACWTDNVKPGATFRVQTGALWVPADAPTGNYTSQITAFGPKGRNLGCWTGVVTIIGANADVTTCAAGALVAVTETLVPVQPVLGNALYFVLTGNNTATTVEDAYSCEITFSQGTYTFAPRDPVACWTGPVNAGAAFRVQTGAVWLPYDAPTGAYTTEIHAWSWEKTYVGCWTGTATVIAQQLE